MQIWPKGRGPHVEKGSKGQCQRKEKEVLESRGEERWYRNLSTAQKLCKKRETLEGKGDKQETSTKNAESIRKEEISTEIRESEKELGMKTIKNREKGEFGHDGLKEAQNKKG